MKRFHEKLRVAVVGCGEFARNFVPLFKLHPYVEAVYVCDKIPERAKQYAERFQVPVIESFEEILADESINAVAIFTERHTHGPLVTAALRAGKDVYSAVPMAGTADDCKMILDAVKETGRIYMMGETCVYYPTSMYCKKRYEAGDFGRFVFGESQYFHDLSHFPKNFRDDRAHSAIPPFLYPTHSTAMILHALDTHVLKVSAVGYRDMEENTPFRCGENPWDNEFSDEFSLMQLANGGCARVSECRRIGYKAPSSYISGFYGTKGSYQFSNAQHIFTTLTENGVRLTDVSDDVNPAAMTAAKENDPDFKNRVANHKWQGSDFSPVQENERSRLPDSYKDAPNGHMASHQFLIDDFCTAVWEQKTPYVNAWRAARYTIPGLIAHESAKMGGILLDVPDFGDAPEEFS